MCMLGCSIFRKETKCSGVLSYVCLYLEYTPHSEEKTHFSDACTKFNMTAHVKLNIYNHWCMIKCTHIRYIVNKLRVFFFGGGGIKSNFKLINANVSLLENFQLQQV